MLAILDAIIGKKEEGPSQYDILNQEASEILSLIKDKENVLNNITDPDLTDSLHAEIEALQAKYRYVLKQARSLIEKDIKE